MLPVLKRGAYGPEVERLQNALTAVGFRPGRIDGRFGAATEAALLAFQRAHGLLADGVAGPVTWHALGLGGSGEPCHILDRITVDLVADMFPFTPLPALRRHLPPVLDGLRAYGLVDKPMVLMALATIRAESEGFVPTEEAISRYNTSPDGHPFDLYDHRRDLGNAGPPDGYRYRGRGFIQLTGRANYARYGAVLGLGTRLLHEPDLALDATTAGLLLAAFLAERRLRIKEALLEGDLRCARRLVNGGTHGLDRFTAAYRTGDRLLDDPVWPARNEMLAA